MPSAPSQHRSILLLLLVVTLILALLYPQSSSSSLTTTTKMNPAKMSTSAFMQTVALRRSIYALNATSPISDARILDLTHQTLRGVPSAFNSQTTRLVVLLKAEHVRFWAMARDVFLADVQDDKAKEALAAKMDGYAKAYGSVRFFSLLCFFFYFLLFALGEMRVCVCDVRERKREREAEGETEKQKPSLYTHTHTHTHAHTHTRTHAHIFHFFVYPQCCSNPGLNPPLTN